MNLWSSGASIALSGGCRGRRGVSLGRLSSHGNELMLGSFRELGVPYSEVLIMRILLFRVLF